MELPDMKYADQLTKGKQVKFRGLNHSIGARDGEIWDMQNMTGDHYPLLCTRSLPWPSCLSKEDEGSMGNSCPR